MLSKLLEGWTGAVLAKIVVLLFIVIFIQKRPQGILPSKVVARRHDMTAANSTSSSIELPPPERLFEPQGLDGFFSSRWIVICAVAPALNLYGQRNSALHLSDYMLGLLGKFMCYAICALAIDLIWGYTGILSLGHGLFFALGGYVMGINNQKIHFLLLK